MKPINEIRIGNRIPELTIEGCLVLKNKPNKDGYIRVVVGSRTDNTRNFKMSHRISWEDKYGLIPEGYEIHHKCRNRACCNISHLELIKISKHKTLTNIERYADTIKLGKAWIKEGKSIRFIAEILDRTESTVYRWKREINV